LDIKSIFTEKEESSAKLKLEELLPKKELKDLAFESGDDFLVIDNNLKDINYKLAPCFNPVFGDTIFGFVSLGVKRRNYVVNKVVFEIKRRLSIKTASFY